MSSLPRDAAERVLRLAIEMQSRRGEHLTEREIHDVARQVGIDPEYLRSALEVEHAREAALQRAAVANAAAEARTPRDRTGLALAILLGLGSAAGAIAMIPDMIQAFRETDTPSEYLYLPLMVLIWLMLMAPFAMLVSEGVQEYRRRRGR